MSQRVLLEHKPVLLRHTPVPNLRSGRCHDTLLDNHRCRYRGTRTRARRRCRVCSGSRPQDNHCCRRSHHRRYRTTVCVVWKQVPVCSRCVVSITVAVRIKPLGRVFGEGVVYAVPMSSARCHVIKLTLVAIAGVIHSGRGVPITVGVHRWVHGPSDGMLAVPNTTSVAETRNDNVLSSWTCCPSINRTSKLQNCVS